MSKKTKARATTVEARSRLWGGIRWGLATLLAIALGVALVAVALTRPRPQLEPLYGQPVPVPPGQVVLACPAVPPTVNPQAVDGTGNPLPPPKIAGSVTSTVLARGGLVPETAVFQPLGSKGGTASGSGAHPNSPVADVDPTTATSSGKGPDGTIDTGEKPVAPPEADPDRDLVLTPRSAMLYGNFTTPVSGFLTAQPWEGKVALAGADIEQSVSSGDYRGLATATCQSAQRESWLVGGATDVGESTVLQLMNPSGNSVEAKVEVWGDVSKVDFARGEKITIPPFGAESLPLESQLDGLQRLVVRVTANGAGVAASLMTHSLTGWTAGGVSLVHATTPPAKNQVIPGVVIDGGLGSLRVLNPGEELARASIEVVDAQGRSPLPGGKDLELDPGAVFDFTLGGLQPGSYAIVINSTQPVVAGAVVYRQGSASTTDPGKFVRDLAWLPARPTGGGVVMGPAAIQRQLVVTNLTGENREYKIAGVTHVVNSGTTAVLPLAEEIPQLVEAPDLYVTQVLTTNLGDGDGIDALEPSPDLDMARQIYVHTTS